MVFQHDFEDNYEILYVYIYLYILYIYVCVRKNSKDFSILNMENNMIKNIKTRL
jgi:hypothetical protein